MDNRKSDTSIVSEKPLITVEKRDVHFIASRPLGISCYEDKLVENAIAQILEQIYEPKFYHESFGFRPNRNCHMAVREIIEMVQHRITSYVLDNWFDVIVKRQCEGECYLIQYADDFVCCFQYKREAKIFRERLEERFRKYGLELAEEKTKILEFGRFAKQNREKRGERKPETFDFLGFTFYCGMDGKKQFFRCRVKTSKKKFRSKIKLMKEWIKDHRTMPLELIFKTVNAKLRGHYQYYGVTDNMREIKNYLFQTKWLLFKWLNRRSQKKSYNLDTFHNGLLRTFSLLEPSIKVSLFYR